MLPAAFIHRSSSQSSLPSFHKYSKRNQSFFVPYGLQKVVIFVVVLLVFLAVPYYFIRISKQSVIPLEADPLKVATDLGQSIAVLQSRLQGEKPDDRTVALKTLVIYVFSATDPEYEANLRFFIREGIQVGQLLVVDGYRSSLICTMV